MAEKLALCFYFDADNDLENNIVNNVMDAFDADLSSGNLDVYIYLDRSNKYGVYQKIHTTSGKVEKDGFDKYLTEIQKNNPWVTDPDKPKPIANKACYLKISYDEGEGENVLTVEKDLGAQDSGSKQTVTDFLNWCAGQCPDATKKILLMADHGSGLERSFNDETIGSALLPQAVADAIKASAWKSVDVLMDDACLMANAEGISNLSGVATYMVASEDFVGGSGCAYEAMLTALNGLDPESSDDYTPQALADLLVESNNDSDRTKIGAVTLSSLNLNNAQKAAMNAFADASDNFTNADWSK